jgi:hypothetical protein
MLHERPYVSARVFALLLSGAAVCPLLAPSWSQQVESSQGAHCAPTTAQAPLSTRLPCLSSRLRSRAECRASTSTCRSLVRGQKLAGSSEAHPHRGLRLSEPAVHVLRQHGRA